MKLLFTKIRIFLIDRFSLKDDSAHDTEIIASISKKVEFKGSNLWALIFAIFIASIGLNINSTAVIIGAMLVSPLMGPIMGVGLGFGINDIELIRKGLKNLLIAVVISIVVSALYFFITPIHSASSELLARTTPSIWDVFIGLFGGLAGIIGDTRKEKNNVIPGVAIATALMPPLCTAGFGLATGQIYYFLGALYLFFINSVFICISAYVIVKYLKLPAKVFEDKKREKRVMKYVLAIVIITALPSVYLTYKIVNKSIFENNAERFVKNEFQFSNTQIINKAFIYKNGREAIDVLLIGSTLSAGTIDSIKSKLPLYQLSGTQLNVRQGLDAKQHIDLSQIKESILEDVYAKQESDKEKTISNKKVLPDSGILAPVPDLKNEIKALYPDIVTYSITRTTILSMDSSKNDTIILFTATFSSSFSLIQTVQLKNWLKSRVITDSVQMVLQQPLVKSKRHPKKRFLPKIN